MGMYDSVMVNCPNCGDEHEFQSKSGDCLLQTYTLKDCPESVLYNINRHAPVTCYCGCYFDVNMDKREPRFRLFMHKNAKDNT